VHLPDGGLLIDDDGVIQWCGPWSDAPASPITATVVDHHGAFVLPGFIDTHLHFPQMYALDAFGGGQLLEWLDHVVFPAEARFEDKDFARTSASAFCERLTAVGTTTSMVFGSQFPHAQDALFDAARQAGLRMVLGRTTMTVGPPSASALLTSEDDAIVLVREEIERWHPRDPVERRQALQQVAVIPRFALSVTPRTLRSLGELYDDYRADGVYFTSHLSENNRPKDGEVATVLSTYSVASYVDVFDGRFRADSGPGGPSLLGRRSVLAHAVHSSDDDLARLAQAESSVAHCPVSQAFLGSGTLPWKRAVGSGVTIAIGSDIAAGDEWFLPRVLNACFKAHHGETGEAGQALHPAELLFTATLAGARALDLEDRIGNFDVGKEADFVVLDPDRCGDLCTLLDQRQPLPDATEDRDALLFVLLMSTREAALTGAYVRGRRLLRDEDRSLAPI
jgi:guanine deaminase